ncbi:MAG: toprim domain-containing protein, partial [Deltaproteobacteria bacterium]|nr:toprim domain-containing protein [Deltaproteobacteria bacterium]
FVEVAEQLAARYGIEVPRIEEPPEVRRARGERLAMLELNKVATAFFREILADGARGELGRAYLEKRGVGKDVADRFQLGYAPADWGLLADHLTAKRADLALAIKVGLLAPRPRSGGYYDRFRDRLVCPVMVPGGDVVGFSARVIGPPATPSPDGSEPPKYINSPESAVYKKSRLLFGLAQAREAMSANKRAVLVEGNFDVITLHQAGFGEVIAPLGTALTIEQVHNLKRLTERIVLLYDGDRAGYKATMHALQMCVEADVEVLVAKRPGHGKSGGAGILADGVDPDSLVASGGAEQLREAVDRAQGGIDFFAHEVWAKARGNTDARARGLEDAARLVAKVATPVKRDLLVATLASALQVDVAVVHGAVARASGQSGNSGHSGHSQAPRSGSYGGAQHGSQSGRPAGSTGNPTAGHPNAPGPSAGTPSPPSTMGPPQLDEVDLISLLADHPDLIASAEADKAFWLLTDARLRSMYSAVREGQSFSDLAPLQLPPPTVQLVLSGRFVDIKDPRAQLVAMTTNLEVRKVQLERAALGKSLRTSGTHPDRELPRLLAQLAQAERKGDHEQVARLTAEISSNRKQVD